MNFVLRYIVRLTVKQRLTRNDPDIEVKKRTQRIVTDTCLFPVFEKSYRPAFFLDDRRKFGTPVKVQSLKGRVLKICAAYIIRTLRAVMFEEERGALKKSFSWNFKRQVGETSFCSRKHQ